MEDFKDQISMDPGSIDNMGLSFLMDSEQFRAYPWIQGEIERDDPLLSEMISSNELLDISIPKEDPMEVEEGPVAKDNMTAVLPKESSDRQVVLPEASACNNKTVAVIQPMTQRLDRVIQDECTKADSPTREHLKNQPGQDLSPEEKCDKNYGVLRFDGEDAVERAISVLKGLKGKCSGLSVSIDWLCPNTRGEVSDDELKREKPTGNKAKKPSARKGNFICKFCAKVFTQNSNLCRHVKTNHRETHIECESCGSVFKRQDYLKAHLRRCQMKKGSSKVETRPGDTAIKVSTGV